MKYSRKNKSRKQRKQKQQKQRKQQKQHKYTRSRQLGGGYAYDIPSNAIVVHRSMDDEGTSPPLFMTKRLMDELVSESERA